MLVLLIRHAQATAQDDARYPDDAVRPLVAKGRRIQRAISRELRQRKLVPDRVYSSPWKRAWQTARILVEETGLRKSDRFRCEALAAPPNRAALAAQIGTVKADETIALVGHEPWLSALAALLLTGNAAGVSIDFPKSAVMGIELVGLDAGAGLGTLRLFLVP